MVRLFDRLMVPCALLVQESNPDGEGGARSQWVEGARFDAAIMRQGASESRSADSDTSAETFLVTTRRDFPLAYHQPFVRLSDGKTFRVTSDSDDRITPTTATFEFAKATAQEWEVPDES